MIVGLPELKTHLRVDGDEEDALIQALSDAAEEQVQSWLGRPVHPDATALPPIGSAQYDSFQIVATPAVQVAIKMMVARMYEHRGGEGGPEEDAAPPLSVRALLAPLRVFSREAQV